MLIKLNNHDHDKAIRICLKTVVIATIGIGMVNYAFAEPTENDFTFISKDKKIMGLTLASPTGWVQHVAGSPIQMESSDVKYSSNNHLTISSMRENSKMIADNFNAGAGSTPFRAEDVGGTAEPEQLNFYGKFNVRIDGYKFDDIYVGQGHYSSVNDWWIKCPDNGRIINNQLQCPDETGHYNLIFTHDSNKSVIFEVQPKQVTLI